MADPAGPFARFLSVLVAVAALAGCGQNETATGGGDAPPPAETPLGPADDEAVVTDTVVTYFNALADRDHSTACLQLGREARRDLAKITQIPGDCEDALGVAFEAITEQELAGLRDVTVTSVSIQGDTAEARIEGGERPIPLARSDGDWLISQLVAA